MNDNGQIVKKTDNAIETTNQLRTVIPEVDILENDNEILLYADLPGVTREDLSIHIDNGKLALNGVRRLVTEGAASWEELGSLEYRRVFSVPQTIDIEKVDAELRDGVLCLHLPKSAAAKPKTIEIRTA